MLLLRWLQGIRSLVRPHHLWSPKRVLWSATLPSSTYSFGTYSLIFVFCISSFISQESLCTTRQTSPRASSTRETITTLHYHCYYLLHLYIYIYIHKHTQSNTLLLLLFWTNCYLLDQFKKIKSFYFTFTHLFPNALPFFM